MKYIILNAIGNRFFSTTFIYSDVEEAKLCCNLLNSGNTENNNHYVVATINTLSL